MLPAGASPYRDAFVYILLSQNESFMKIGISNNMERRLEKLERDTPFNFSVLCLRHFKSANHAAGVEKYLHHMFINALFKNFSGCGEWFLFDDSACSLLNRFHSKYGHIVNNPPVYHRKAFKVSI